MACIESLLIQRRLSGQDWLALSCCICIESDPPTCLVEKSNKQLRASNQNKPDCLSCGCRSHCVSGHLHKIEPLSTFPCSMLSAFKFLVAQQVAAGCKARSHSQWMAAYSCFSFWVYVNSPSWIIVGPCSVCIWPAEGEQVQLLFPMSLRGHKTVWKPGMCTWF